MIKTRGSKQQQHSSSSLVTRRSTGSIATPTTTSSSLDTDSSANKSRRWTICSCKLPSFCRLVILASLVAMVVLLGPPPNRQTWEAALVATSTLTTSTPLSPRDMLVALSDMLPGFRGSCPDLPGFPASTLQVAEIYACGNVLQHHAAATDSKTTSCIIYNFGVGKTDQFLSTMGTDPAYTNCQVYAFDPFVSEQEAPAFGPNIHFFPIGLWNGHSNRNVGVGTLKSLLEIQEMLNHTKETEITFFRSDCEGCEYGWVKHAMEEDPTIFERIQQMFIEIHTVPVRGMPALPLPWKNGEPPEDLLEPLYTMMTKYFRVLASEMNPGYPTDRNRVPLELQREGVVSYPCCREFHLVNKALAGPQKEEWKVDDASCQERAAPIFGGGVKKSALMKQDNHLSDEFSTLFHGRRGTCPDGKAPRTFQGDAFCPDMLHSKEATGKTCMIYFFGDFAVDTDFLELLADQHPNCVIYALDHEWKESFWTKNTSTGATKTVTKRPNVRFFPWGIYPGHGPRSTKTTVRGEEVIGELYTMAEIGRAWTGHDFAPFKDTISPPGQIEMIRVDWKRTPQCVWEKELSKPFKTWWGRYQGIKSIEQAS